MKRRLIALALVPLLFNVGCTTTRYVTVGCVSAEQYEELRKAEPPKIADQLEGKKADEGIRIVAGSAVRLRGYAHGLLNVLGGCVG